MQTAKILIVFSVLWFESQQSPAPAPDLFIYLFKSQQSPAAAPDDRIVGGQEASVGQFPFIASLKTQLSKWYFHFCGGSALSTTHIITAAHCVDDKRAEAIFVSMGDHNKNIEDENEEMIQAKKIVIHQAFDVRTLENDIGMKKHIVLASYFQYFFSNHQTENSICTPSKTPNNTNDARNKFP